MKPARMKKRIRDSSNYLSVVQLRQLLISKIAKKHLLHIHIKIFVFPVAKLPSPYYHPFALLLKKDVVMVTSVET